MGAIRFVDGKDRHFESNEVRAANDPELSATVGKMMGGRAPGGRFTHHEGEPDEPQLFEIRLPPDTEVPSHAHVSDEIVYVVEGEIVFGKRTYGPGSSVFIPKMTLYAFRSGPEGLTFLNFRPVVTTGAIVKDDFLSMRRA